MCFDVNVFCVSYFTYVNLIQVGSWRDEYMMIYAATCPFAAEAIYPVSFIHLSVL